MTYIDLKPKDLAMTTNTGLCSQCGEYNSIYFNCDCKNAKFEKVQPFPYFELAPTKEVGMKFDNGKLLYSLIPPETLKALAEVLTFGAQKYAPNNWQLVENGETRYLDALFRHLEAFRSGETHDPDSKLHHLSHVLTNVAFLHYLHTKESK